jgi:hypothetical protein
VILDILRKAKFFGWLEILGKGYSFQVAWVNIYL